MSVRSGLPENTSSWHQRGHDLVSLAQQAMLQGLDFEPLVGKCVGFTQHSLLSGHPSICESV